MHAPGQISVAFIAYVQSAQRVRPEMGQAVPLLAAARPVGSAQPSLSQMLGGNQAVGCAMMTQATMHGQLQAPVGMGTTPNAAMMGMIHGIRPGAIGMMPMMGLPPTASQASNAPLQVA